MAHIKIQEWSAPTGIAEARAFVGQVLHICVGGEIRSTGTSWFELFRLARVRSVRERTAADRTCPRCSESARFAVEVAWESGYTDARAMEVCEHCIDGHVTAGGEAFTFEA